jgi:type II secretory pathway pseudopilin PulG
MNSRQPLKKNQQGFTLIELFISTAIIMILIGIGTVSQMRGSQIGRNNKRKADLKSIHAALEQYFSVNRRYPSTCSGGAQTCAEASAAWWGEASGFTPPGGVPFIQGLTPTYLPKLPSDPRANKDNAPTGYAGNCQAWTSGYLYRSTGKDFKAIAVCTPEGTMAATDPFYDQARPTHAWQVTNNVNVTKTW